MVVSVVDVLSGLDRPAIGGVDRGIDQFRTQAGIIGDEFRARPPLADPHLEVFVLAVPRPRAATQRSAERPAQIPLAVSDRSLNAPAMVMSMVDDLYPVLVDEILEPRLVVCVVRYIGRMVRIVLVYRRMKEDDPPPIRRGVLRQDPFEPDTLISANIPRVARRCVICLVVESDDERIAPPKVEVALFPNRIPNIGLLI